ncbi:MULTISPECIES: M15 family metallopeptidase [unclassified Microbulbifer]|uniref:M15 family metallopeptidase n=1 Tax=unclassified Microbulbifer TaxID=2619833 RepID=UPI0027E441CC|nr:MULTISPECIES: M15 family metallopeptidase [unclassified Microbulbifer]
MLEAPLQQMLFGLGDEHVILEPRSGQLLHPEAMVAFERLSADAQMAGFDPRVVSGFRSFERQRTIWNNKVAGSRPVLDSAGEPLDMAQLSPEQAAFAILRWSALPGASRHHWGTDFDVVDAAAMPADYRLQLSPQEVADNGIFGPFHRWLDAQIVAGRSYGLFRPYAEDRGGVAPERWHLSYAPRARELQRLLTPELLRAQLQSCELALGDVVCGNIESIFQRFIWVPEECYPDNFDFP